jgi:hypothetical protein
MKRKNRLLLSATFCVLGGLTGITEENLISETHAELRRHLAANGMEGASAVYYKGDGHTLIIYQEIGRNLSCLKGLDIHNLYARDIGMERLDGIEVLENLQTLDICFNHVTDFSPLRNLPLRSLKIAGNPVRDISPVLKPSLRELNIFGTEIDDLACLTNTALTKLVIGDEPVMRSFKTLSMLPLKQLVFSQCSEMQIGDIASLRLERLDVSYIQQDDLCHLTNMPFQELVLRNSGITSLAPLASLPIRSLTISSGSLVFLNGIERLPLEELHLINSRVMDVWPIRNMRLKELTLLCDDGDLTTITNLPLHTLYLKKELAVKNIPLLKTMETLEFIGFSRHPLDGRYTAKEFFEIYGKEEREP